LFFQVLSHIAHDEGMHQKGYRKMPQIKEEALDFTLLSQLLQAEEQRRQVASADDWEKARMGRKAFLTQVAMLRRRIEGLPRIADESHVRWSRQMLRIANLAFLVVDTTGTKEGSDVMRLYLADREGNSLFDQVIKPERTSVPNTSYTGLSLAQVQAGAHLSEVWPDFLAALNEHVLVAFGLDFVTRHLTENALHYGLESPLPSLTLGECLLTRAKEYYGEPGYLRLVQICEWIRYPLLHNSASPARAKGQVAFLRAMSQGIMRITDEEIDESPF
jgi:hypothetical protein